MQVFQRVHGGGLLEACVDEHNPVMSGSVHACFRPFCAVVCPNDCSGNGRCLGINELSIEYGPDVTDPAASGDGFGVAYTNWDADVAHGCFCDWGYFGPDCSMRTWYNS